MNKIICENCKERVYECDECGETFSTNEVIFCIEHECDEPNHFCSGVCMKDYYTPHYIISKTIKGDEK